MLRTQTNNSQPFLLKTATNSDMTAPVAMRAFGSRELSQSTLSGLSLKGIQWQQFDGGQSHPLVSDDIQTGKSYADQKTIVLKIIYL